MAAATASVVQVDLSQNVQPPESSARSPNIIDQTQSDALRLDALDKRRVLEEALADYTRAAGQNPQFIFGPHARPTSINPQKLVGAEVLSKRELIVERLSNEGNVAEVGTQTGQFAKFILSTHPNVKLHTIDIDYSYFDQDGVAPFVAAGRLDTIVGSSWEELARFPDDYSSWIYIDASQYYNHVKNDLESAKRRVRIGGHIVCNAYTNWSPFEGNPYGVAQAVNEFLAAEDFVVTHLALHPFGYNNIAMRRCS